MESLIGNNQKRKRRKTRKNLDAIRKKARKDLLHTDNNKNRDVELNLKNKSLASKASICITSNRLTLFRKAIRSETVSRRILSQEENKKNIKSNTNENINILENLIIQPLKEQITHIFTASSNSQSVIRVSLENKNISNTSAQKTPSSVILFSPLHQTEESDKSENLQINTHQSDHSGFDLSSINNSNSQNKLYKNFMNKIPNYLKQTASVLIKTDILNKCKNSLKNLYIDDHLKNDESSTSNCDFTLMQSDQESIVKNSINYMDYSSKKKSINYMDYSSKKNSKRELLLSPTLSMASHSTGQPSSPISFVISDSPEYLYYPHRLNQ